MIRQDYQTGISGRVEPEYTNPSQFANRDCVIWQFAWVCSDVSHENVQSLAGDSGKTIDLIHFLAIIFLCLSAHSINWGNLGKNENEKNKD